MRIILALAGAALLGGCATYEPTPLAIEMGKNAVPPASLEAMETAVRGYFETSLFDPDSAQIKVERPVNGYYSSLGDGYHGWFACGQMNAKNRFGGYVGYRTFWVYFDPRDPTRVLGGDVDAADSSYAAWTCQEIRATDSGAPWTPIP